MKWLFKLFARPERDMVLLRMHDNRHMLKPVEWFNGIPFAAPYLPDTRCELLPGGKLIGGCYIKGWRPASPRMAEFYDAVTHGVGSPAAPQPFQLPRHGSIGIGFTTEQVHEIIRQRDAQWAGVHGVRERRGPPQPVCDGCPGPGKRGSCSWCADSHAAHGVSAAPKLFQCDACDWKGGEHELVQQCPGLCCPKCLGDVSEADASGVKGQQHG